MRTAIVIMKNGVPCAVILNPTPSKVKHNIDSIRDEWHKGLKTSGDSIKIKISKVHSREVILID
jgi:hypothetical protein